MKVLHIVSDDKFIDDAIELFNSIANISNRYVCIVDDSETANYEFKYIKQIGKVDVIPISNSEELWKDQSIDLFVFHALPECLYHYVLTIPAEKKVMWSAWGYDIYTGMIKPLLDLNIYKPMTQKSIDPLFRPKPSFFTTVKRNVKYCINYKGFRDKVIKENDDHTEKLIFRQRLIERIDYMATVLPIEYDMLAKNKGFRAKYVPFQYTSKSIDNLHMQQSKNGTYILLGNSADFSNNHIDVLKILRERTIKNTIFIPLAYGSDDCKQIIKSNIHPSDNILLQEKFVSIESYMNILGQCKVAIFGHIRQQALNNIRIAMQSGMKIFFYKSSVCYKYFKANGYYVYSIEDDLTQKSIDQAMGISEIRNNIEKINDLFSFDNVLHKMQKFFNEEFNLL